MTVLDHYAAQLDALETRQLRRTRRNVQALHGVHMRVDGRDMLAFCSNDYLGLAQHPALIDAAQRGARRWGVGATASPLVCGHTESHAALELRIAEFLGVARCISTPASRPTWACCLPSPAAATRCSAMRSTMPA
jgi:8-amino-7-oxononanoate synthase